MEKINLNQKTEKQHQEEIEVLQARVLVLEKCETLHKQTEEGLRLTEYQQKAILNNIPDIAWLKDKESRFIAVNEPFGQACGFSPKDLVGKKDWNALRFYFHKGLSSLWFLAFPIFSIFHITAVNKAMNIFPNTSFGTNKIFPNTLYLFEKIKPNRTNSQAQNQWIHTQLHPQQTFHLNLPQIGLFGVSIFSTPSL